MAAVASLNGLVPGLIPHIIIASTSTATDAEARACFWGGCWGICGPKPGARLLDLACGKGRHSRYLSEQGYDVTGVDLVGPAALPTPRQFGHAHLRFHRARYARCACPHGPFDLVLNLFTSFGYFEEEAQNVVALRNAAAALRPGGKLVIDFLNTDRAIRELVTHESKTVDGLDFRLYRHLHNDFIVKEIQFEDEQGPAAALRGAGAGSRRGPVRGVLPHGRPAPGRNAGRLPAAPL